MQCFLHAIHLSLALSIDGLAQTLFAFFSKLDTSAPNDHFVTSGIFPLSPGSLSEKISKVLTLKYFVIRQIFHLFLKIKSKKKKLYMN